MSVCLWPPRPPDTESECKKVSHGAEWLGDDDERYDACCAYCSINGAITTVIVVVVAWLPHGLSLFHTVPTIIVLLVYTCRYGLIYISNAKSLFPFKHLEILQCVQKRCRGNRENFFFFTRRRVCKFSLQLLNLQR